MAIGSAGDLVARLGLDSTGLVRGATQGRQAVDRLAQEITRSVLTSEEKLVVEQQKVNQAFARGSITAETYRRKLQQLSQTTANAGQRSLKMQSNLTQLAFAAEDASVSFGTGGLAGSIRGASNNLVLIAATSGGAKGALAAVAVVATVQLVPALLKATGIIEEQTGAIEKFRDQLQSLEDEFKRLAGLAELNLDTALGLRDIGGIEKSSQALSAQQQAADEQLRLGIQLQRNEEERLRTSRELTKSLQEGSDELQTVGGFLQAIVTSSTENRIAEQQAAGAKRLKELEQERLEILMQIDQQRRLEAAAALRAPKLAADEEAERQRDLREERKKADDRTEKDRKRAADKDAKAQERLQKENERGQERATGLARQIAGEIDPEGQKLRGIGFRLQDRLEEISGLTGISESQRSALAEAAKRAAATQAAGLGTEGGRPAPEAAIARGSQEFANTLARALSPGRKKEPTEQTQQKIEKHLNEINKKLKQGDPLVLGAFRGGSG